MNFKPSILACRPVKGIVIYSSHLHGNRKRQSVQQRLSCKKLDLKEILLKVWHHHDMWISQSDFILPDIHDLQTNENSMRLPKVSMAVLSFFFWIFQTLSCLWKFISMDLFFSFWQIDFSHWLSYCVIRKQLYIFTYLLKIIRPIDTVFGSWF